MPNQHPNPLERRAVAKYGALNNEAAKTGVLTVNHVVDKFIVMTDTYRNYIKTSPAAVGSERRANRRQLPLLLPNFIRS